MRDETRLVTAAGAAAEEAEGTAGCLRLDLVRAEASGLGVIAKLSSC